MCGRIIHGIGCVILLLGVAVCGFVFSKGRAEALPDPPPGSGHVMAAPIPAEIHSPISNTPTRQPSLARLVSDYSSNIFGLLNLLILWLLVRPYQAERKRKYRRLSLDEIGLLRIIKHNANRPDRNVVRLDDWRE